MSRPLNFWCAGVLAIAVFNAIAQDAGNPGEYLVELSPSAAALGAGGGSVAYSPTTDAIYLNPGLLGTVHFLEVAADYQRLVNGYVFYSTAFAYPFGTFGTAGIQILGEVSPDAPRYDEFGIQRGDYGVSDNAVLFSYGIQLHQLFGVGANIKMVYKRIDTYNDMGVGFDLGVNSQPFPWLAIGLSCASLGGPTLRLLQVDETYTTALKSGIAVLLFDKRLNVTADVDVLEIFADQANYSGAITHPIRWRVGLDGQPRPWVGAHIGANERMVTAGFDLSVANISAEYGIGISTERTELNNGLTHAFSIRWQIGRPIPVQDQELAQKTQAVNARADLQKAQELYIRGYHSDAKKLLTAYCKLYPTDADAAAMLADINGKLSSGEVTDLMEKAQIEFSKRAYAQAETLLTQALILQPRDEKANALKQKLMVVKENDKHLVAVRSLYGQQKYDEMAAELELILRLDSLNREALDYRSKISEFLKQREAEAHYTQASKLYYEQKKVEEANAELQAALNLDPNHKEALALHEKLGKEVKEIYLKRVGQMVDNKSLAVDNKDLKKLIQLDLQDRLLQIRNLISGHQYSQAFAEVNVVIRDAPEDSKALLLKKEIDDSLKSEKASRLYGEALRLFNDGVLDQAEAKAVEASDLVSTNADVIKLLGDVRIKRRAINLDEARKLLQSGKSVDLESARAKVDAYLAVDSTSQPAIELQRDIKTELLVLEADGFIEKGDYEKADKVIQQALRVNPDNKKVKESFKNLREAMDALK